MQGRQRAAPVKVGRNCFVGTRSILLKGAALPDCSVLGAGSVLTSGEETPFSLYSGNPAKRVRALAPEAKYFNRQDGVIR
jgi:carbonic anhydrase/acetyltransferase-like protein (isoleucine patch superfamily)